MNLQQILSELRSQRGRLEQAIAALEGLTPRRGPGRPPKSAREPRTMSAAARKRIGAAKKAWWAKRKGQTAPKKPAQKRPHISAAGRKRLSQLMKARWAERKKGKG